MIRPPTVAGTFYPADRDTLEETLRSVTSPYEADLNPAGPALGIVVPHAGYVYSGHVAGAVYSRLHLPKRFIILCPNHTGLGRPLAVMSSGEWETPIGNVAVDTDLAMQLMALDSDLEEDAQAHRSEHALEVQLPFLQFLTESELKFVPITVGTSDLGVLNRLGNAMAEVIDRCSDDILIIASSDMNHYESDPTTRVKDGMAIDRILVRDADGLYNIVLSEGISMCGVGPATAMLVAANRLGASNAELVRYATSGDTFGDRDRVVGYAGIIVS